MLKYYIDNQLVSPPLEYKSDGERIYFDEDIKGRLSTNSQDSLTFVDEGFEILSKAYCSGVCQELPYSVIECCDGVTKDIFNGFIRLSEVVLGFVDCKVEVTPVSDSFAFKINANKDVKIRPSFTESKNGTKITPVESYGIFSGAGGVKTAHLLKDVFAHAIQYVTDGEITLQAGGILDDPDCEWITITNGAKLSSNPSGDPIEYTFNELLDCIIRLKGAAWTIKDGEFILKPYCDLFVCSKPLEFKDLKILSIEADQDSIYSDIKLGGAFKKSLDGKETDCNGASVGPLLYPGIGSGLPSWGETELVIPYGCSSDNTLDLSCSAIYDHNNVEDSYERCSEENAESIYFIDTVPSDLTINLLEMKRTPIDGLVGTFYNEFFINQNVLDRNECYLRSIGIPYDDLFPLVSRCGITTTGRGYILVGGERLSLNLNTLAGSVSTYDPNGYTANHLLPGGQQFSEAWVFTPPNEGCYRVCLNMQLIFEVVDKQWQGTTKGDFVLLEYPSLTEVFREAVYFTNISGNDSYFEWAVNQCFEVALDPVKSYILNGIFEDQSVFFAPPDPPITFVEAVLIGSCINVYPCGDNILLINSGVKQALATVEGLVCREDWLEWKNNAEQCINSSIECLCNASFKGWIDDVDYNYDTNKFTGTLKGNYECLDCEELDCRDVEVFAVDYSQNRTGVDLNQDIFFSQIETFDGITGTITPFVSPPLIVSGGVVQDLVAVSAGYLAKINAILVADGVAPLLSFEITNVDISGANQVIVEFTSKSEDNIFNPAIPRFSDIWMTWSGGNARSFPSLTRTETVEICE